MPARLSINLFSPLPPAQSDVANFTSLVATALQEAADVTVWTAQAETPTCGSGLAVQRFNPAQMPWPALHRADLNVYNLGNNATFHRAIFDVARQAPGVIILHDTRLQHFFARYSETPGEDRDFYLASMRRSHGLDALADARAFVAGEQPLDTLVDRYPMTLAALDGALAAITHNAADRDTLAAQTRTPVFYLPLAFAGPGPADPAPTGGTLRLTVFGFIGLNRRLEHILAALAGHSDTDIQLDVYGELEQPGHLDAWLIEFGLSDRVRHHGFVPEAELTRALQRTHLALNLRFPSMGEASGSQLRIWDAALPSLVTRTGWYASLPEDAVFFVEPDDEVASIRRHLTALRKDPERFRQAGQRGRHWVLRRHTPAAYAEGLLDIARRAPELHARLQGISLARRAAHALMDVAGFPAIALCADPVAEAVRALTQPPG